jgi:hypothetical protein
MPKCVRGKKGFSHLQDSGKNPYKGEFMVRWLLLPVVQTVYDELGKTLLRQQTNKG